MTGAPLLSTLLFGSGTTPGVAGTFSASGILATVEMAYTTDLLDVPTAWTDLTPWVRRMSTRRGRNHELGKTAAGVATITLDNRDRRFDPTFTSSPYYPDLVPMTHIRINAMYNAVTYPVFYGFVENWGQSWPAPAANGMGDAQVDVQAVDAFKVFNLFDLASYPSEVLADAPFVYYPFDDPPGTTTILNRGSLEGDAATLFVEDVDGVTFGVPGPLLGDATAVELLATTAAGHQLTTAEAGSNELDTPLVWTVEFWLKWPDTTSGVVVALLVENLGGDGHWVTRLDNAVPNEWSIEYHRPNGDLVVVQMTGSTATAGIYQHWAFTRSGSDFRVYRNGVLVSTRTAVPNVKSEDPPSLQIGTVIDDTGDLAYFAYYDKALTPERIASHAAATTGTFVASQTGARVDELLDSIGWPASLRDLDAGMSSVAETNGEGNLLSSLQEAAEDTENGVFFMAADNTATFIDRAHIESTVSSLATFGDGAGEVPYQDLAFSYDDQDLWTEVTVSGATDQATVSDAAAVTRYGRRTLEVSGQEATANGVQDVAHGLLGRYHAPAMRPTTLTLAKAAAATQQMARLIGDRVTIKRRPPGGGTMSVDAIIEGIDHDVSTDGWLVTTFSLVPANTNVPWLLADTTYGILGSTTDLGW